MTDKQIIIDEIEINPNYWLEPYKPIPACEIKDCAHLVYAGNDVYGCRFAEDGLVCDDFNNDDECCMYRQLEYYKEALKAKEQECEELKETQKNSRCAWKSFEGTFCPEAQEQLDQLKAENKHLNDLLNQALKELEKTRETLTEIKEVLQFYNNTTIGLDKGNGKFEFEVCNDKVLGGKLIYCYDTNPAKQALQKISECEGNDVRS
jgi:flagellar motility protein MotE (MotC chaperone)